MREAKQKQRASERLPHIPYLHKLCTCDVETWVPIYKQMEAWSWCSAGQCASSTIYCCLTNNDLWGNKRAQVQNFMSIMRTLPGPNISVIFNHHSFMNTSKINIIFLIIKRGKKPYNNKLILSYMLWCQVFIGSISVWIWFWKTQHNFSRALLQMKRSFMVALPHKTIPHYYGGGCPRLKEEPWRFSTGSPHH